MKKVIGVISIVLFLIVSLQSCVAGLGNTITENGEVSGTAGIMLSIFMLIGGIIAIVSRTSKGMTIAAIVFYVLGGLIGISNVGTYADLKIWSILSFIFAALILFHLRKNKEDYNKKATND